MTIRQCSLQSDIKFLCQIYNYYIENTISTFEEQIVQEQEMKSRVEKVFTNNFIWVVLENTSKNIVGYGYIKNWMERSAYRITLEVSIYIHQNEQKKGYGQLLLEYLISWAKNQKGKYNSVIAIICGQNIQSANFFTKNGFQKVAHFKEVGLKFGNKLDTCHYQLIL